MKKYNAFYFLLFVLVIMGGFASMALNSYGMVILGCTATAFSLLFLIQFIGAIREKQSKSLMSITELSCLFMLSFFFVLRIFYIHIAYIEILFEIVAFVLILINIKKITDFYNAYKTESLSFSLLVYFFYFSIIAYLVSLATITVAGKFSEIMGIAAFIILVAVIAGGLIKGSFIYNGENISLFRWMVSLKDNSLLIISMFLLFSLYEGFTRFGIIPKLYSDEYPQAYFEMIKNAEAKKEKPVNGTYQYEDFKIKYDKYLRQFSSR